MRPFLLEIGCEELPARFIKPAKEGLSKLLADGLQTFRIDHSAITLYATPRRLAVLIDQMGEKQTETVTVKFGPPAARAYDETGAALPSALGFAKSLGVDVSELKIRKKDNADLICVEKVEKGLETTVVLAGLLPDVISRIPFQKRMRWGQGTFEFGRPLHWVVALLGSQIIPFEVAGITSGNITRGHRFLSPGDATIKDAGHYLADMKAHYIIVDECERMDMMTEAIRTIEADNGARAVTNDELLEEIRYITEYPYGLKGSFEDKYLNLPKAVLVNVMEGHQRYVPLEKQDGSLLSGFIFFANTIPVTPTEVIRGNEKVLKARLADGQFFFEEDKRVSLDSLYGRLEAVMFHKRLGNLKDKTERIRRIGVGLASAVGLPLEPKIARAALLIKADLLTHMVGEFPELQGTMGRIYAEHQGEDGDIARAIEEHYYPIGTDGPPPASELGSIMALADKLDSLIAFFSVAITPTGNLDPFALRRQAIGSIRTIIAKEYHVPLQRVFETGYQALTVGDKVSFETLSDTLSDFIATRFKFLMMEEGHNQEFINTILPCVARDVFDGYLRLGALETQRSIEDFRRLMIGFKRVYNIAKTITEEKLIDSSLFEHKEEQDLYELYQAKQGAFQAEIEARRYDGAIDILVGFKETIDNYFDKVFVMVEDERVKDNRLALLTKIKNMFLKYGDFSKIRVEELQQK
jgi:glycyl-tRNA synthetase beta chain